MTKRTPSRAEIRALNNRVQTVMRRRGLTTRALAHRLDIAHSAVVQWFSIDSTPAAKALIRLPKALGVNGHWLLTGRGPKTPP